MSDTIPAMVTAAGVDPASRNLRDAQAIARLVGDMRQMLRDAPADEPDVAAILADCEAAARVARWLLTPAIQLPAVLPVGALRA